MTNLGTDRQKQIKRPVILILTGTYLPGFKGGGPIRSLVNLTRYLQDEFDFRILTLDRDIGDEKSYPNIKVDSWQVVDNSKVYYLTLNGSLIHKFIRVIQDIQFDVLYLNSFFSPVFSIMPLWLWYLGLIQRKPLVLAPRGEFSPGALKLKWMKKFLYITAVKALGLHKKITWQATSLLEREDIYRVFGRKITVVVAPNLSAPYNGSKNSSKIKVAGELAVVFLSRISPKKNLKFALKVLYGLKGKVTFNIYGPVEDRRYWSECLDLIQSLPENITVQYFGAVSHEKVNEIMSKHDLLLFPTLGENFGHVILEAFCAGCPVVISDRTPWRNLAHKGVGWDIPLDQPQRFQKVLQDCILMDAQAYKELSQRAYEYGIQYTVDQTAIDQNRLLFRGLL